MARIGRLAGTMIVEADGAFFVVGQTKEPCDWAASGFEAPPANEGVATVHVRRLLPKGEPRLREPILTVARSDEGVADLIGRRFLIERNGSVSERLWRLVLTPGGDLDAPTSGVFDANWLAEMPDAVWNVVRDSVLKCS